MARRKEEISQRDFGYGSPRPEAVEREDTPLVQEGVEEALNTIGLTTGAIKIRPGLVHVGDTDSDLGMEVELGSGRTYDLHIVPSGLILYDSSGSVLTSFLSNAWTSVSGIFGSPAFADIDFWVMTDPDSSSILIGARNLPIHALSVDTGGAWSFGLMQFAASLAGAVKQPYWNYYSGISLQPSARTGAITLTASSGIWVAAHTGLRVRIHEREIVLGSVVSPTVINATVTEELPPTYNVSVASVSGYQVGEAVEHDTLGGQGIITSTYGSTVTVLATGLWDGFSTSGNLVGPNANQAISGLSTISPAPTFLWDLQMQSPVHGYAGWGAKHKGRAYLCDFPGAPQGFAVSVAGFIDDFTMGEMDGDGFVESLGADTGGDLRYILSAEDLIFFTSRGLFYQQTRDGSEITPRKIGPVRFSKIGCARIKPVAVDDGAIFVDAVGKQIYAAVLAGDVYRSWAAQNISHFHSHLITEPAFIGATQSGSEWPEQFIYVVNQDGSAAVCQWDRQNNKVGWRAWTTIGSFKSVYQVFGRSYAVVERTINAVKSNFRERFETGIYMDAVACLKVSVGYPQGEVGAKYFAGVTKAATHFDGHTPTVYFEGWDMGDRLISAFGAPLNDLGDILPFPIYDGILQIGLPFDVRVKPWPRRSVNTQRGLRNVKRHIKVQITIMDTLTVAFRGRTFGGYRAGESLAVPPPLRTEEVAFITGGRTAFEDLAFTVERPGPFCILKIKHRVTV